MTGRADAHGPRDADVTAALPVGGGPDSGLDSGLDGALLDALDRGELPARFREDVTARLRADRLVFSDAGAPAGRDRAGSMAGSDAAVHGDAAFSDTVLLPEVLAGPTVLTALPDLDDPAGSAGAVTRFDRDRADRRLVMPAQRRPLRGSAADTVVLRALELNPDGSPLAGPDDLIGSGAAADVPPTFTGGHARRRRKRFDRVVVAAVAAAAILGAGSAGSVAFAAAAQPGDTLWPISRVVYPERAKSVQARAEARSALGRAKEAADAGDTAHARSYLEQAKEKSQDVREVEGRSTLRGEADAMLKEIDDPDDGDFDESQVSSSYRDQRRQHRNRRSPTPATDATTASSPAAEPTPVEPTPTATSPGPSTQSTPVPSASAESPGTLSGTP